MRVKRSVIYTTISIYFFMICNADSLPEDYITDNDEQLARLKRENFLDAILKHLPFFHSKSNSRKDISNEQNKKEESVDQRGELSGKIAASMSSTLSPSVSSSYEVRDIIISSFIDATKSSYSSSSSEPEKSLLANNFTSSSIHVNAENVTSTFSPIFATKSSIGAKPSFAPTTSQSFSNLPSNKAVTESLSRSSVLVSNLSTIHETDATPIVTFPVSTMKYSAMLVAGPSMPAPHSISSFSDTAPLTSAPVRTVFSSIQPLPTPDFPPTKSVIRQYSTSLPIISASLPEVMLDMQAKKTMPPLPDEKGLDKIDFLPAGIENTKEVGFVYINILLPIVSGITGALLITFAIMLFRCCRRRKLKRVRYFGGKPKSDFVRLDKMNLLTDTSDEDEFD